MAKSNQDDRPAIRYDIHDVPTSDSLLEVAQWAEARLPSRYAGHRKFFRAKLLAHISEVRDAAESLRMDAGDARKQSGRRGGDNAHALLAKLAEES
jgi:hypothetical protein